MWECREMDSGSSTPSSMAPSAAASPRRWSSFGNRGRLSEEGGAMLRRASEAAGLAEAGLAEAGLHTHLPPNPSGSSSPDHGTDYQRLPVQQLRLSLPAHAACCSQKSCQEVSTR